MARNANKALAGCVNGIPLLCMNLGQEPQLVGLIWVLEGQLEAERKREKERQRVRKVALQRFG